MSDRRVAKSTKGAGMHLVSGCIFRVRLAPDADLWVSKHVGLFSHLGKSMSSELYIEHCQFLRYSLTVW